MKWSPKSRFAALVLVLGCVALAQAISQRLTSEPVASPNKTLKATIEWEDVGYVGLLRMIVFDAKGEMQRKVELPQLSPEPISIVWINNEWVGSESYVGERGGGFFFVHAPSGRGYLLDIFEPRPNADWIYTIRSTDPVSTSPISTVARGRTSLFPILLRDPPKSQTDYLSTEFVERFTHSVDVYNDFRRANRIRDIELRSPADIRDDLGGILLAQVDGVPEIMYFPAGAVTPEEMLTRVRRQALPEGPLNLLTQPGAPEVRVRWLEGGEFVIERAGASSSQQTTGTVVHRGKFENVADAPYVAPTPTPEPTPEPKKTVVSDSKDDDDGDESSEKRETERNTKAKKTPAAVTKPPVVATKPGKATPKPSPTKRVSAGELKSRR